MQYPELALPAGNQRGIEAASTGVRQQRVVGTPHVAVGMSFLLVGAAVFRPGFLELLDEAQRRVEVAGVATANGAHVERIGVVGFGLEQPGKLG